VVAFVGAKGGVGTTTIALNVAVALARQDLRTTLVETARFHGSLGSLVGLVGSGSIDLLPLDDPERMTLAEVDGVLRGHSSGVRILAGASGGRSAPPAEGVMALGNALRALSHQVVVDLDNAVDVYGQVVLRTAERIWVVTQPEPISVERSGTLVAMLEVWGVDPRSIGLMVNQTSPEMVMEPAEIGQRVGRSVGCWVPCAAAATFEASRRGLPLIEIARDHPAANALTALAGTLLGRQTVGAR
jgi:pilus assembly protein CpaE